MERDGVMEREGKSNTGKVRYGMWFHAFHGGLPEHQAGVDVELKRGDAPDGTCSSLQHQCETAH